MARYWQQTLTVNVFVPVSFSKLLLQCILDVIISELEHTLMVGYIQVQGNVFGLPFLPLTWGRGVGITCVQMEDSLYAPSLFMV